ncbi:hypothetical protein K438DRAFT_1766400 [Mycena galopus ATCC 62051]|nr:hypothetical protein K438DRAFT_1789059 [Mycena galopus ATCC 62051]KAF8184317.1 hypothetical protein K438DRAFT_1766400 [Mycena galopus ATCC 62051]
MFDASPLFILPPLRINIILEVFLRCHILSQKCDPLQAWSEKDWAPKPLAINTPGDRVTERRRRNGAPWGFTQRDGAAIESGSTGNDHEEQYPSAAQEPQFPGAKEMNKKLRRKKGKKREKREGCAAETRRGREAKGIFLGAWVDRRVKAGWKEAGSQRQATGQTKC